MFESLQGEKKIIPKAACALRAALPENEQKIYDEICRAISLRKNSVTVACAPTADFARIVHAVWREQPFFYYLKNGSMKCSASMFHATISWEFHLSNAEMDRYDRQLEKKLRSFKLPKGGSVLKREIYLHDMLQKLGLRAGESDWTDHTIIGPMLLGHTVCQGMALMFYLLCVMSNVPCRCIIGQGVSRGVEGSHEWNLVEINGKYVHVDAFWDVLNYQESFNGYSYDYFNLSDRYIRQDHSWDSAEYPKCTSDEYSFFGLQKADVYSFEEYCRLVQRCYAKGKYTVTARMHYDYRVETCTQKVMDVYQAGGIEGLTYRKNDKQRILEIRVKKRR